MFENIFHVIKWAKIHTQDGIERTLSPSEFREINDRVYVPSYIQADNAKIYLRTESTPNDEYFAVRRSLQTRKNLFPTFKNPNGSQSISISPPEEFTRVDTEIVDCCNAESVSVQVTFRYPDNQSIQKSMEYNIQDTHLQEGDTLPVSISVSKPATSASVTLDARCSGTNINSLFALPKIVRQYDWKTNQLPQLSLPAPRGKDGTPIFLISVDTFRYDALDEFEPVLELLGDDAVIPDEPRTQGNWTRPAHASMFTGVHPGIHGYVGTGSESVGQYGIHPDLVTIPELLTDCMYKCSGCTPKDKTGVEYGFGRGMHRFAYKPISWHNAEYDGADIVDQVIRWLDRDYKEHSKRLFYFLHLFDSHYPYLPTVSSEVSPVDFNVLNELNSCRIIDDYLDVVENPPKLDSKKVELVKSYYYQAVNYAANQIKRLILHLKHLGLYSDSLLIITGDHGEDFLEREFAGHNSVTHANIRPGMIIKPPNDSNLNVPASADTIDFLPTIAAFVGKHPPEQCAGVAWQNDSEADRPRITERFDPSYFTISLEIDSKKAVYTYEGNHPEYPTKNQLESGPIDIRYYDASSRSSGNALDTTRPQQRLRDEIEQLIFEHIRAKKKKECSDTGQGVEASEEVKQRLQQLGYT